MSYESPSYDGTAGPYLGWINEKPLLTREQEIELGRRVIEGDGEARDTFIRSNLRLAVSVAKLYMGRGVDLVDLIEEANIGLMHAVDTFDPERGARFSTYAGWWIKQAVGKAVTNQSNKRPIRVPSYALDVLNKVRRLHKRFVDETGEQPTIEELYEIFSGESPPIGDERGMKEYSKNLRGFESLVRRSGASGSSMDGGTPENHRLQFDPEDPGLLDPLESIGSSEISRLAMDAILGDNGLGDNGKILNDKEKTVLISRRGLDGRPPMTLRQTGKVIGLTRERARQIEIKALKKLRVYLSN